MQIGANNWDVEIYKLERYMYFLKETKDFLTFFNHALTVWMIKSAECRNIWGASTLKFYGTYRFSVLDFQLFLTYLPTTMLEDF